jgi:stringent starvation protein B
MSDTSSPTSTKPYMVRAIHEWCTDNGLTPYLAVAVTKDVQVPQEHVRNGEIVLNIGLLATDRLMLKNDAISFQARFSGRVQEIYVPMEQVVAIYAKETGNGMAFEVNKDLALVNDDDSNPLTRPESDHRSDRSDQDSGLSQHPDPPKPPAGRPRLTRVK